VLFASLIVSACVVPAAFAAVDLSWNRPAGSPGAETELTFDCANPDAVHSVYVVFDVPATLPDVVAMEFSIGAATQGRIVAGVHEPFEPFWHFETAGCNEGAIGVSDELPVDVSGYADPWGPHGSQGQASIAALVYAAADPGIMRVDVRIDRASPVSLVSGTEYFGGRLDWYLTCASVCGGCDQPVAIVLDDVRLIRQGGEIVHLAPNGLGCISANGGDCSITGPRLAFESGERFEVPVHSGAAVCEPVPVRPSTWGSLKTLYR